jgi:uncharacterized integral membrane protein
MIKEINMNDKIIIWVKGLVSAAISAAAGSAALVIVDPATFNLQEGLSQLVTVAVSMSIVAVANYLAKSPLPQ